MDQLIPVVAKLQDVLGAVGHGRDSMDLPQIVVVGGQSSGKSSVLEGIVGRSFLPRGSGIVTRRPLVLQLYNTAVPLASPHQKNDVVENKDRVLFEDAHEDEEQYQLQQGSESFNEDNRKENSSKNVATPASGQAGGLHGGGRQQLQDDGNDSGEDKEAIIDGLRPGDEWGEFLHLPGRRYYDFAAIRDEIVRETDRTTGRNRGISSQPMHLKIFSPRVLHLTMVDLPGIAKVAIGDQPPDIEDQIREMCLTYISNPNAIILAVTAGNTDLANSDALKLARCVDPGGDRTIGVLTKLDLMDPGTDASDMLHNRVIPLQRGYVGVVNRGQLDIDLDKSIQEGLKKEAEFFRSHPGYRSLKHKCGTTNLAKSLNNILMYHIRECLPELKGRIMGMMADVQQELDALGSPTDMTSNSTLGGSLLALLSKFSASFANCIDGKGTSSEGLEMAELFGGARIAFIFNEVFVRSLMAVEPFDGLTDEEIRTTICNANGTRQSLFVPEISFDILVRRQISRLEQPGLQCVDLVFNELQRIAAQCEPTEFQRFPNLRERMAEVVSSLLRRCVSPTQLMVSNLVKIELSYINTSHPDFIGGAKAVARLMEKMGKDGSGLNGARRGAGSVARGSAGGAITAPTPVLSQDDEVSSVQEDVNTAVEGENGVVPSSSGGGIMNYLFRGKNDDTRALNGTAGRSSMPPTVVQLPQVPDTMRHPDLPTEREQIETDMIKSLIDSYFCIVRKNFNDMVPKTIMYFLVNHTRDSLQNELVSELYKDALIPDLMQEAADIAQRRNTCHEMRDLLTKALEIVNEVRDFNTFK